MKLVTLKFLGCTTTVDEPFADVLRTAERALLSQYEAMADALPPGVPRPTFAEWHGVRRVGGYGNRRGWHGKGRAVDLNYTTNPYIATRRGHAFGGEAAGKGLGLRRAAVEVYDRACIAFQGHPADVSGRKPGESTAAAWDRFEAVNVALQSYFAPYFRVSAALIERRPVPRFATAPLEAFAPLVEHGELFVPLHDVPLQALRDYEAVRLPTVVGAPSESPPVTRNPARGIMDLPRHTVVALSDLGGVPLRWGMIDFGDVRASSETEAGENGDGMHFDMGTRARPLP